LVYEQSGTANSGKLSNPLSRPLSYFPGTRNTIL
jgi:hypothetical protein